jgi:UDP:flavonoid glycosyltransferase YjiC (YdhE family)
LSAIYGAPIIQRIVSGYKKVLKITKQEEPEHIISDADFPTLLTIARHRHDLDGYFLTNTLRIGTLGKELLDIGTTGRLLHTSLKDLFNEKVDSLFLYLYKRTQKIYCLDFPKPYTLARHNLFADSFDFNGKLKYCGLIKGKNPEDLPSKEEIMEKLDLNPELPTIYIGISGPTKYRVIRFFKNLYINCEDKNILITTGRPSTDNVYKNKNVKVFDWYPVREELIKVADVVVARAGLSTISEILLFGKKSILIPELQPEQMENARALERRGLCMTIHKKPIDEDFFEMQLKTILNDTQITDRLKEYQSLCRQYDALSMITNDFN